MLLELDHKFGTLRVGLLKSDNIVCEFRKLIYKEPTILAAGTEAVFTRTQLEEREKWLGLVQSYELTN